MPKEKGPPVKPRRSFFPYNFKYLSNNLNRFSRSLNSIPENIDSSFSSTESFNMTTEQDNTTQTTEQTINHSEIFNSLRIPDAIKDLPKFDGNPRLLFEFLNNVEEILLHIRGTDNTPYGQILLRAIRNKVEGQANEILNMYGTPLIWDDIKTNLILHYSDKRTETSLIRDLHNIRQYNKTIQSFYGEIIEIQSALCNNILIQEINPSVIQAKKNLYSEMCLNSFLSGLNEPLGSRVRTMQPDSLATALSCCIKEQNISYQRYSQQYRYRPYNYNSGQNQTYSYNSRQNPRYTNNSNQNQTYPYNSRQNTRYTNSSGQNQSRTNYNNQNQWQSNNPFSKSPPMRNTQNFNEPSHSRPFQKKETQFNKFQNPNSSPKIKTSPSQQIKNTNFNLQEVQDDNLGSFQQLDEYFDNEPTNINDNQNFFYTTSKSPPDI